MSDGARRPVLRVVVRESTAGGATQYAQPLAPGDTVALGRTAPLRLGADDEGVSRVALTVTAGPDGWTVQVGNRNGAQLHPWAQAPTWLPGGSGTVLRWPRVGLRLLGNDPHAERWVLLEGDEYAPPGLDDEPAASADTLLTPRPRGLTLNQLTALYATFPDHVAWPPVSRPVSRPLEAVAHRLGVTASAVRERLRPVQERAQDLGLPDPRGVTDPDYVFHLATHGYLTEVPPPVAVR